MECNAARARDLWKLPIITVAAGIRSRTWLPGREPCQCACNLSGPLLPGAVRPMAAAGSRAANQFLTSAQQRVNLPSCRRIRPKAGTGMAKINSTGGTGFPQCQRWQTWPAARLAIPLLHPRPPRRVRRPGASPDPDDSQALTFQQQQFKRASGRLQTDAINQRETLVPATMAPYTRPLFIIQNRWRTVP